MPVTYQPQFRLHGTTTWTNWGGAISTTSVTIGSNPPGPSLNASTNYDVQVIASNAIGSTTSNLVSATTAAGVTIQSIVLSGSKAFTTGTNNAVVGTIAVTMSSGSFSGTLRTGGNDAGSFQIVNVSGVNTLETNGTLTVAKTYSVTIVANQPGAGNTPLTSAAQNIVGSAAVTESPDPTSVTTVGPAITNSIGESWTLVNSGGTLNFQIAVNGVIDQPTNNVILLYYTKHLVYQENSSFLWWSKSVSSDTWTPTSDPRVSPTGTPTAPSQVTAAFGSAPRLAFNSDFVSASEVTGDTTAGSGFSWYPGLNHDTTYTVKTTATAASINNGNVGGGPNASPSGGILTLLSQNSGWSGLFTTLPVWTLNFNGAVLPAVGQGHWGPHAYFEAYMQFVSNGNTGTVNTGATGGPAFWSWAAQDVAGYGMGSSSLIVSDNAEVDFMEHFGTMFGGSNTWESSWVHWQGATNLASATYASGTTDSNWHTYGVLWKSTGAGTGSITMYFDNVLQASANTFSVMENQSLFMVLGTGNNNWNTNVDWVRVWTP